MLKKSALKSIEFNVNLKSNNIPIMVIEKIIIINYSNDYWQLDYLQLEDMFLGRVSPTELASMGQFLLGSSGKILKSRQR